MMYPLRIVTVVVALGGCSSFGVAQSAQDGGVTPGSKVDGSTGPDASPPTGASYASLVRDDKPIAYWRFGETSGTVARSEVDSPAMDAEISGPPAWGRGGAIASDPNTAFEFSGNDDQYVSAGSRFDFKGREPFSL